MAQENAEARFRPRINAAGQRIYRIHSTQKNFTGSAYALRVPASLARLIGPDAEFTIELTDDGILYRKVSGNIATKLPDWLSA